VKAGVNVTSLKGLTDELGRLGFHVGLIAKIPVYKNIYFAPEIQYVQKGTFDFPLTPAKNLRYIEIPILLNYQPIHLLEVNAGFTAGAKIESDFGYKTIIAALSSGLLFNVTNKIFITSRFNYDLMSLAENTSMNYLGQSITENTKGYSILLSVGYRIKS
jgi:hypothetical protein